MSTIKEKLSRIHEIAGTRRQTELAEWLGIRQSSISDAASRDALPAGWLITALEKTQVNPSWIMTGKGAKYLVPSENAPIIREIRVLPEELGLDGLAEAIRQKCPHAHITIEF